MGAQLAVHFGCQRRHGQTVLPGESLEQRLRDAAEIVAPLPQALLERSEEHTSELQSRVDLVCRLLLEKKKKKNKNDIHTNKSDKNQITDNATRYIRNHLR